MDRCFTGLSNKLVHQAAVMETAMFPVAGLFAEDDEDDESECAGDDAVHGKANEEVVEEAEHEEREHEFPCGQVRPLHIEHRKSTRF